MSIELPISLGIFFERLDCGLVLGECLFFPGMSRLAANSERVGQALAANLHKLVPSLPRSQLGRCRMATTADVRTIQVQVDPPRPYPHWRDPVRLTFHAVVWQHGQEGVVGRVPALGIEAIVTKPDELNDQLEREILACLRREGHTADLSSLAWVQRASRVKFTWTKEPIRIRSLKQLAQQAAEEAELDKPSVLKQIATDLTKEVLSPAYELDEVVTAIADALTARQPQSVLLVGSSGVGKTAAVRELVRNRAALQLGATPFFQTSGSRLVAGMSGFGMWQERCRDLWKESSKRRAVLHLGSLVELMEVGKSECDTTGIASFLRPYIARGDLLTIAECTPEQVPMIEREAPQLLDAFRQIRVAEPSTDRGRIILQKFAATAPVDDSRPLAMGTLETLDRLHRRYATYSAYPGRPLRFLENLMRDTPKGATVTPTRVLSAFARETGLPQVLLDPATPLNLAETRSWFAGRVIGQPEAVELVVDLLATVKAGLTRPNRPIASLLFIGPTGVGKTEMAKALAEFLFGSRDRLTRFDMSEFADPLSVQRLAGGVFGSEGLLTAKVREQPFAVLLFDEFEKAHPAFFDLLLQILGEARLTDAGGRLADFRNAVIILTSNLGAESFQQGSYGFSEPTTGAAEARHAKEHFTREVERFLRPELFNRLDRLVPFAPLDAATIRLIAKREWDKVLARDGVRFRSVRVDAVDAVLAHLAKAGFDVRYGARPLKRCVERELLAPLAHQMNRYPSDVALNATVGVDGEKLIATVKPRLDAAGRVVSAMQAASHLADLAREASVLRRQLQHLERCSAVRELRNDIFQLERLERDWLRKQKHGKKLSQPQQEQLARLARLRELSDKVNNLSRDTVALEDSALLAFHTSTETPPATSALEGSLQVLHSVWDELLLELYALSCSEPNSITLILYSEDRGALWEMASAYTRIAEFEKLGIRIAYEFRLATEGGTPSKDDPSLPRTLRERKEDDPYATWFKDVLLTTFDKTIVPLVRRRRIDDLHEFLEHPRADTIGILLQVRGAGAYLRFVSEAGLHLLRIPGESTSASEPAKVLVETNESPAIDYLPPHGVTRRGFIGKQDRRRIYDGEKMYVEDLRLERTLPWRGEDLAVFLRDLLALRMRAILKQLVME